MKLQLSILPILIFPFCFYLAYIGEYEYAGLLCVLIFVLLAIDIHKRTRELSIYLNGVLHLSWGIVLDFSVGSMPFFTISSIVLYSAVSVRLLNIRKFSYATYRYFESAFVLFAIFLVMLASFLYRPPWYVYLQIAIIVTNGIINATNILLNNREFNKREGNYQYSVLNKKAPYFELKDQSNELVSLNDYLGNKHLLLIFVRGDWCPYCHMMLRTYLKHKEKFAEKNIMVLAIGPDPVGVNRGMVEQLGLDYKVLSDDKLLTAQQYGIQLPDFDLPGATKHDEGMPLPASFLVDKEGVVRYTSSTAKVGEFLDPSLIFPVVESLN